MEIIWSIKKKYYIIGSLKNIDFLICISVNPVLNYFP